MKIPYAKPLKLWRRKWQPTPVFLPVEFHGQNSTDRGAWRVMVHGVAKELDTTERLKHTETWESSIVLKGLP